MMSEHVIVDQTAKLEARVLLPLLPVPSDAAGVMGCIRITLPTCLQGMYLEAFTRVFSLLEDSGWKLVREGEVEDEDSKSFDDLPSLGYIQPL